VAVHKGCKLSFLRHVHRIQEGITFDTIIVLRIFISIGVFALKQLITKIDYCFLSIFVCKCYDDASQ